VPPWRTEDPLDWIATLAEPYLRGYAPVLETGDGLSGYRLVAPGFAATSRKGPVRSGVRHSQAAGFFLGFLAGPAALPFLRSQPPECLVFCWVQPVGGPLHRRLVQAPDSLIRNTGEYIRWLTHRLPRFELYPDEVAPLVRHVPMAQWPSDKTQHLAQNFYVETLAWLVRSALVRRLADGGARPVGASAPAGKY
jgi:hypothetical protein